MVVAVVIEENSTNLLTVKSIELDKPFTPMYWDAKALGIFKPTAAGRSTVPKSDILIGAALANPSEVRPNDVAVEVPFPKFQTLKLSM